MITDTLLKQNFTLSSFEGSPIFSNISRNIFDKKVQETSLPEILFITSYPPRVCGIATYSQDLYNAIQDKFGSTFSLKICALEKNRDENNYADNVKYVLHTTQLDHYIKLANQLNADSNLQLIYIQHEFGLFGGEYGNYLLHLLSKLTKPVIVTFHTVLPKPNAEIKKLVEDIGMLSKSIVVMTKNAAAILENEYKIIPEKISVIPHGTHLISSSKKITTDSKTHFAGRFVLSTFGLLNDGKSIETALDALPKIVAVFPNVIYLIIGKTHPEVVKKEGEKYRDFLYAKVIENNLQNHVIFIDKYLSLDCLLKYLQSTDIYLFTSKNPDQAVSGTLAYAMGCGCPVISTPIPHAKELLDGAGVNFDFQNAEQLADAAITLISNPKLLEEMRSNAMHRISPTAWQNIAIAYAELSQKNSNKKIALQFNMPEISLRHINQLTTDTGMIQFSKIGMPDLQSGYTLDDNARALIAVTKHYELTNDFFDLGLIEIYLDFITSCQQPDGSFLNYQNIDGAFSLQNDAENLEDSNGRAIWALGEFLSYSRLFPKDYSEQALCAINNAIKRVHTFNSPRAIAFIIKGLYHYNLLKASIVIEGIIVELADNLASKYKEVSDKDWRWYEEYLTYANSLLPEAMLYAWLCTRDELYMTIAKSSFDFLLVHTFKGNQIKVVSNQGWYQKGQIANQFGEQPIDVAYTILALDIFYKTFQESSYLHKMRVAFNWFLGKNHLRQIVYNPVTGGCYDGLEEYHVNLNQGAESTVSYLLARLTVEKYLVEQKITKVSKKQTALATV